MTLAILLIIAIAWGVAFWKWPERVFGLLPLILPCYVIRTSIGPLPTTLLELMIGSMTVAWILIKIREQRSDRASLLTRLFPITSRLSIPIGLWLIVGLISIFVAQDHLSALGLYRAYFIEPILIFAIGCSIIAKKERTVFVRRLLSAMAFVIIALAGWCVIQWVTGFGVPYPWNQPGQFRAVGPFPFPNALALFVTPIATLLFADLIRGWKTRLERIIPAWLSAVGFASSILVILLAQSDGGLIALGCASFLALLLNKKTRIFGVGLAVACIILVGSIAPLRERAETVLLFREWSSKVRITMWKETIEMLKDRPILGAGLGGYPDAIQPYHLSANWMETFQYPHNIFLNLWSETGLIGVFVFGWILVGWATSTKKDPCAKHDARLILPIILAILVHGLVDVPYFKNDLAILFWLLILMTTICDQQKISDANAS
jgi:O-antigen ligase